MSVLRGGRCLMLVRPFQAEPLHKPHRPVAGVPAFTGLVGGEAPAAVAIAVAALVADCVAAGGHRSACDSRVCPGPSGACVTQVIVRGRLLLRANPRRRPFAAGSVPQPVGREQQRQGGGQIIGPRRAELEHHVELRMLRLGLHQRHFAQQRRRRLVLDDEVFVFTQSG